ncbi:MAG: helix-turn-helix domain-containing protein [Parachlamydiaceae bacterium]
MFATIKKLSHPLKMKSSKSLPIVGFERNPKGKLLTQFVDFNDSIGVAYERCVGYFKDFHVHDRVNLTFPRAAAVIDFSTLKPKNQYLIDSHSVLWMPAFVEHSQDTRSVVYDNLAIFPTDEVLEQILRNFIVRYNVSGKLPQETVKKKRSLLLDELLNEFFVERVLERKAPKKLINLAYQIVEETLRIVLRPKRSIETKGLEKVNENFEEDPQVVRAVRFIEANLFERLSIEAIANHSALSPATLFRRFSVHFGIAPMEYITRRRLDEAFSLLKADFGSVTDIAIIVGYSDLAAFSKAFKKQFGQSPKHLRSKK